MTYIVKREEFYRAIISQIYKLSSAVLQVLIPVVKLSFVIDNTIIFLEFQ